MCLVCFHYNNVMATIDKVAQPICKGHQVVIESAATKNLKSAALLTGTDGGQKAPIIFFWRRHHTDLQKRLGKFIPCIPKKCGNELREWGE